jgi:hypothetical protein
MKFRQFEMSLTQSKLSTATRACLYPPMYVEKLAILYSKTKRKVLELEILERYEGFMNKMNWNGSPGLIKRLSVLRTKFE